ncbi:MAG: zf-HC2 domain-containing protein, partial [Gemmatimonadaceae bacterium]
MSDSASPHSTMCDQFEANVSNYLERALPELEQQAMEAHVLLCANCAALLDDMHKIIESAANLPNLKASRDLWPGISARIDADVTSINSAQNIVAARAPKRISLQVFGIAATALVMISSGATYAFMSRAKGAAATNTVANVAAPVTTVPVESATAPSAPFIAVSNRPAESTYEHEIVAMRRIVDERLGDLDSTTVFEIQRNLKI